jgi:hypothetical protein
MTQRGTASILQADGARRRRIGVTMNGKYPRWYVKGKHRNPTAAEYRNVILPWVRKNGYRDPRLVFPATYPNATHYSKHFSRSELNCKGPECRGKQPPAAVQANLVKLAAKLEQVRKRYGNPVSLLSGYRCPVHNANVGGATKSTHMEGKAADFARITPKLRGIVNEVFADGGLSNYGGRGLHGDNGPKRRW